MLTSAYRSHRLLAYQPPATMAAAPPTNRTIHGSVPVPEPEGPPPVDGRATGMLGTDVGEGVSCSGKPAGVAAGLAVGGGVGLAVGDGVGLGVGDGVGLGVGDGVGLAVGDGVGLGVGGGVGLVVGDGVGVRQIASGTFSQPVIWSQLSVVHASPSSQSSGEPV